VRGDTKPSTVSCLCAEREAASLDPESAGTSLTTSVSISSSVSARAVDEGPLFGGEQEALESVEGGRREEGEEGDGGVVSVEFTTRSSASIIVFSPSVVASSSAF